MKKHIYYLFVLFVTVACSEDFLDLSPTDAANTNDFYTTESDFEVALIGAYGQIDATVLIYLSDIRSDNATAYANAGGFQRLSEFDADPTAADIARLYQNSYRAIQAANAIVDRIEATELDTAAKDRIVGEAKFIRALSYFYLVNIYGDVPLILEEITGANLEGVRSIPRTPVSEVYAQIISDLMDAEQRAPAFSTANRASSLAAKALLGKVYLYRENYTAAVEKLNEVITSGQFSLEPDYGSLYQIGNAGNTESIFLIEYLGSPNDTGSPLAFHTAPAGTSVGSFVQPLQVIYAEINLNQAYGDDDSRKDLSAMAFFAPGDQGAINDSVYITNKYKDENPFEMNNASNNNYILRYADVLLMRAEALNEIGYSGSGEAFDLLNQVRQRAGLEALDATDLPDQTTFREAALTERRLELAMEGERWFDLVRTGTAIETINAINPALTIIDENDLLYPVPQREIDNNPDVITQNPGY